tara:strand:- start:654 stop:1019 length:366 start_codon:yes stop_codon:yes gene_type:complete
MALLLWFVTLMVLALILSGPFFNLPELTTISIFPIVILILLAEEFIGVQIGKSFQEASRLTIETIITSFLGYAIFKWGFLRSWVLLYPHLLILASLILNLLIGKFAGLRLLEYRRFRKLLE